MIKKTKEPIRISVGRKLKEARLASSMTQLDIATKLKKGKSSISDVENGRHETTLMLVEQHASAMGKKVVISIE